MAAKPFENDLLSNDIAHKIGQRLRMTPVALGARIDIEAKNWLDSEEADGTFIVATLDTQLVFYFSDPDTAFGFKLRFS